MIERVVPKISSIRERIKFWTKIPQKLSHDARGNICTIKQKKKVPMNQELRRRRTLRIKIVKCISERGKGQRPQHLHVVQLRNKITVESLFLFIIHYPAQ